MNQVPRQFSKLQTVLTISFHLTNFVKVLSDPSYSYLDDLNSLLIHELLVSESGPGPVVVTLLDPFVSHI